MTRGFAPVVAALQQPIALLQGNVTVPCRQIRHDKLAGKPDKGSGIASKLMTMLHLLARRAGAIAASPASAVVLSWNPSDLARMQRTVDSSCQSERDPAFQLCYTKHLRQACRPQLRTLLHLRWHRSFSQHGTCSAAAQLHAKHNGGE